MSIEIWIALVALFFVGGLTPGPAVMLVLGSSFRYGFRPAMLAALGVASANVFWLILAASGAAALAVTYPKGFLALKIIGLLIIFWLGLSTIFGPLGQLDNVGKNLPKKRLLYGKGLVLQLTNPMALVTFAGILPAFFDTSWAIVPQFFIMISTLTVLELNGLGIYAGFGHVIRERLKSKAFARGFNIAVGSIMIMAGTAAVLLTGNA